MNCYADPLEVAALLRRRADASTNLTAEQQQLDRTLALVKASGGWIVRVSPETNGRGKK